MTEQIIMDLTISKQLRDIGCEQVDREAWRVAALAGLKEFVLLQDTDFALEDFRKWWLEKGNPDAHHVNAWGSLGRIAVKQGIIKPHGFGRARSVAAHARIVWRYT